MKTLADIFKSWRFRPQYDKEAYAKVKKFHWTIYGPTDPKDLKKKWNCFHYLFKYRVFVPLLKILKKFIKLQPITEEPHNFNLLLFDEIFEQSINDWNLMYQSNDHVIAGDISLEILKKKNQGMASKQLRYMKDLVLQGAMLDTAYREFLNILIYNLCVETKDVYDGQKIEHLFYNRKYLTDLEYRAWWNNHAAFIGGKRNIKTGVDKDGATTYGSGL